MQILYETSTGAKRDFKNVVHEVSDEPSYDRIMAYIDFVRTSPLADIIAGGNGNTSNGYFVEPTAIVISDPHFPTM